MVFTDGEWVESDLLLGKGVGGMLRRGLSQKVQTYNFAATGAGVQLYESTALMLNGEKMMKYT